MLTICDYNDKARKTCNFTKAKCMIIYGDEYNGGLEGPSLTPEQIKDRVSPILNASIGGDLPPDFCSSLAPEGHVVDPLGGIFSRLQEGCGPGMPKLSLSYKNAVGEPGIISPAPLRGFERKS